MKNVVLLLVVILLLSLTAIAYAEEGWKEGPTPPNMPPGWREKISKPTPNYEVAPPKEFDDFNKKAVRKFKVKAERMGRSKMIQLSEGLTKPYNGRPEEAVAKFLKENHKLLYLSADLSEMKIERLDRLGRGTTILYKQYYKGVPFEYGCGHVDIDDDGKIFDVGFGIEDIGADFSVEPVIKTEELFNTLKATSPEYTSKINPDDGKPLPPVLFIYVIYPDDTPVLAYKVSMLKGGDPEEWWSLVIDSSTGKILREFCYKPIE